MPQDPSNAQMPTDHTQPATDVAANDQVTRKAASGIRTKDSTGVGIALALATAEEARKRHAGASKGGSLAYAQARAAEALARQRSAQEQIVLQQVLPLWSDEHRGVPNPMLRSGLFGVKQTSSRALVKNKQVAALSQYNVLYKGEELLQDDLSVWMALLHRASRQPIGDTLFFTGYELIKDLGWRMHSDSYARIQESISRLKANELKIQLKSGKAGYAGSLIREYAWDALAPDGKERWMVRFEPMLAELFRDDTVTFLAWEQRKRIGSRATLALWLHAYFASHRDPLPITIEKIHELTGSEQKEIRFFRRKVREALDRLRDIQFLVDYWLEGDTVYVKKAPHNILNLKPAARQRLLT